MPTCFSALRTDDVCASLTRLCHMLGMTDHVHIQDAILVEFVDDVLWSHTYGGHKQFSTSRNDDINQLVQRSFGIIELLN